MLSQSHFMAGWRRFCDHLPSKQADLLVRVPSPAPICTSSLCRPVRSRLATTRQRLGKQGDDVFMCQKACSGILPLFQATSCLGARDILPLPAHCLTKIFLSPLQASIFLRLCSCLSFKTLTSLGFSGAEEEHEVE